MASRYHIGDKLEIKIEKIVTNGLGMGFGEGITVFVPLSAVGDILAVELRQIKGRTAFAAIEKILEPGIDRAKPVCEHFGVCGGCDFQHLKYSAQLEAKASIIRDCFERIGHIQLDVEIEMIGSPKDTAYRLRTQFHYDRVIDRFGFFKRLSHEVIDVEHCPVLTDEMNDLLGVLRGKTGEFVEGKAELLHVEAAAIGEKSSIYSEHLIEPMDEIEFAVGEEVYFFTSNGFFQANKHALHLLVDAAVGDLEGKHALDLYAGSGLFTLPLARAFEEVVAVESDENAVRGAERSAELGRIENVEFVRETVREFLGDKRSNRRPDLVLVDPPRGGIKRNVLNKLVKFGAATFVYVSCNPSTLARDLAHLLENGYRIESIKGIDMFPQTSHVETVVRLTLKS